jgi:hypothetical protein
MVNNAWVSTWKTSALRAAQIEPTPYALKALELWNKSTPTEPWSKNPIGIPSRGYTRRSIPGTPYALFLSYTDFSTAFVKCLQSESQKGLSLLISSGESTAKLWKAIRELNWPGTSTESDYPGAIHEWIGDEYRSKLNIPEKSEYKSSGTTDVSRMNNHRVLQTQRAMITAIQTKQDLAKAILLITKGVR